MTLHDVSVVIAAYRPHDLGNIVSSLLANTDVSAEWIVVDDGSGPEFDAIFSVLPDSVKVSRLKKNSGQSAARNVGLSIASARWVKFLDADDRLDKGHLAALVDAAKQATDFTIPFASTKHIYANGTGFVNTSWQDLPMDSYTQLRRQLVKPFLCHCGALFPRHLLDRLCGYDESLITDEDGDLLLRILQAGYHYMPVEGVFYIYTHHDNNPRVSTDDSMSKLQSRIRVCDKFKVSYSKSMPADIGEALAQRLDNIAMSYWSAFPKESKQLLTQAQAISKGYLPDIGVPLRVIRYLGGPSIAFRVAELFRRIKGWLLASVGG